MRVRNTVVTAAGALVLTSALACAAWPANVALAASHRASDQRPGEILTAGWRTVSYDGISLRVPRAWPVLNLTVDRSACPWLDVHAVYLGTPGPGIWPGHQDGGGADRPGGLRQP
jgi:hypothetical protein